MSLARAAAVKNIKNAAAQTRKFFYAFLIHLALKIALIFSVNLRPNFWVLVLKSFFCMSCGVGLGGDLRKRVIRLAASKFKRGFFILSLDS